MDRFYDRVVRTLNNIPQPNNLLEIIADEMRIGSMSIAERYFAAHGKKPRLINCSLDMDSERLVFAAEYVPE